MVSTWSIPPLLLASINVFLAAHYLVIHVRTRRSREPLTFACLALILGIYDVCCGFLYSAASPAGGRPWQLAQYGALTVGAVVLLLFVADYTRRPAGRLFTVLCCAYALLWAAVLTGGTSLLVTHTPFVRHVLLPFGLEATFNEMAAGPLAPVHDAIGLGVFVSIFIAGAAQYRAGERGRATRLMVVIGVFFLAAANDAAFGLGLIRSIYLIEYAFMGVVVLMADSLSKDLVSAGQAVEALARSEDRFRSLVQHSYDYITVLDENGTVAYATPSAASALGYDGDALIGKSAFGLVHPDDLQLVSEAFKRVGQGTPVGTPIEFRVRRADGSWRIVEGLGTNLLEHPAVRGILANIHDVTEQRLAEESMKRTLRELKVLNAVAQAAVAAEDEEELIARVTAVVREALFPDDCGVLLLDDDRRELRFTSSYVRDSVPGAGGRNPIPVDMGITGLVARTGASVRVDDVGTDDRYLANSPGMRSELCAPLTLGTRVIGVFNAESRSAGSFSESDEHVLSTICGQLSTAIGSLREANAHVEAEERFRRLAESAFEGIGIHDNGRIIDANTQLAEMLGYDLSGIMGKQVMDFVAPASAEEVSGFIRTGRNDIYEHLAVRKDGSVFPVETQGKPLGTGTVRVAAVRDITERKRAESQIRHQVARLAALRAIDATITGGHELPETLEVVLDTVLTQLHVDAALILRLDASGLRLVPAAGRGIPEDAKSSGTIRLGEGAAGRAAATRELVWVPDLADDRTLCLTEQRLAGQGFRSSFAAPLVAKGRVHGVVEVFRTSIEPPEAEWIGYLETIAGQLAIAIDNRTLVESLEESNAELQRAYDTTLEGWSRALELRDRETQGHCARLVELTLAVAGAMGMPKDELVHLRRGVLLHDIGKMAIPDSILFKAGPLTTEEWAVMQQHPRFAYDLLQPIEFLRPALEVPLCHHEWWDGSGYPRGLKGEEIPLSARIFAVADTWDALSHQRPYREAWPPQRVRDHIIAEAGTHFDPSVVDVFLATVAG